MKILKAVLSKKQKALMKQHGTPAQFAAVCYSEVPRMISMTEARQAIDKYSREWAESNK